MAAEKTFLSVLLLLLHMVSSSAHPFVERPFFLSFGYGRHFRFVIVFFIKGQV